MGYYKFGLKMTIQEKILAGLQQKFSGADNATLVRIATKKAEGVTDEAQVQAIVDSVSFGDVMQSYGDFRVGDATKTAIANYEKKHNLKDGKPAEEPKKDEELKKDEDNVPAWAQAIIESNKALTAKVASYEAEKSAAQRQASISAKAKEYGIPENLVSMLKIADDADLDVYMKDAKQTFANLGFEGVVPPHEGNKQEKNSEDIAALINKGTADIVKQQN